MSQEPSCALFGVVISTWVDRGLINYGTGFAISPRMIMTCSHNIYLAKFGLFPNPAEGLFNRQKEKVYVSMGHEFYRANPLDPTKSFRYTTKEELTLFVLRESLDIKDEDFIKLGNILPHEQKKDLHLSGYPRYDTMRSGLQYANFKKQKSVGILYRRKPIKDSRVRYTNTTYKGYSGAGGLLQMDNGKWKIVFIHTHAGRGNKYKQGLYFNDREVVKCLDRWLRELEDIHGLEHRDYFQEELQQLIMDGEETMKISNSVYQYQFNQEFRILVFTGDFSTQDQRNVSVLSQRLNPQQQQQSLFSQRFQIFELQLLQIKEQQQQRRRIKQQSIQNFERFPEQQQFIQEQFLNTSGVSINGLQWILGWQNHNEDESDCSLIESAMQKWGGRDEITACFLKVRQ